MDKPKPRHNVSGEYGVWDIKTKRWVLNTEFKSYKEAKRLQRILNNH